MMISQSGPTASLRFLQLVTALCCVTHLSNSVNGQILNVKAEASNVSPGQAMDKTELVSPNISPAKMAVGVSYCNVIFKNLATRAGVKYTVYVFVNHYPVLFYKKGASPVVYYAGKLEYGEEATMFATPNIGGYPALYYAYAYPSKATPKQPWDRAFKSSRSYEWTNNGNFRLISNPFGKVNEVARVGFRALPVNRNGNTKITLTIN